MNLFHALLASRASSGAPYVPPMSAIASKLNINFAKADWFLAFDDYDYFKNYLINSLDATTQSGSITIDANGYPTGTGVWRITAVPSSMKAGTWHVICTGTVASVAVSSAVTGAITTTAQSATRWTFNLASPKGLLIDPAERIRIDYTNPSGLTGLYLVHDDEYIEGTYATQPLKTAIAQSLATVKCLRHMDSVRVLNDGYTVDINQPTGDSYTVTSDGLNLTLVGASSDITNLDNAITSRGGIANVVISVYQYQDYGNAFRTIATGWNAGTKTLTLQSNIRTALTAPNAGTYQIAIRVVEKRTWANRTKTKDYLQVSSVSKANSALTASGEGCWHQGMSYELQVAISNQLNCDMWITIHHTMGSSDLQSLLSYINTNLNAGLKCYLELSNEMWNFSFYTYDYYSIRTRQISGTGTGNSGASLGAATDFVAMCNTISTWMQANLPSDVGRATLKAARTGLGRFVRVLAWQQENLSQLAAELVGGERAGARADVFSTAPYVQAGISLWNATTPLLANLTSAPFNTYPDYRRVEVEQDGNTYYRLGGTFVQWRLTDASTNIQILANLKLAMDYLVSPNTYDEQYLRDDFAYCANFTNNASLAIPMPMYQYEGGADYYNYANELGISNARWATFVESPQFVEFLTYYFEKIKAMQTLYNLPDYMIGYYGLAFEGWGMYADTSKMIPSNQVSQFLLANAVKS